MLDLVEFCIKNDPTPPNFSLDLFYEDKVKAKDTKYMTDDERALVISTRIEFY
jgi:hypothetical protein